LNLLALCDELLSLARGSLDYATIAHRSQPLCVGSFTIGALVQEIDRQFAALARARQVHWEAHASDPESMVDTDATRCQQILGKIVSNALKYTPPGGHVRLDIAVEGDFWRISVSDSGAGIPESCREKVFEPFVRLARDERAGTEGNGLGLAVCRELVDQLRGTIDLDSSEIGGTSLSIRFPLAATTNAVTEP
jgi:signal transduction histidine kinase